MTLKKILLLFLLLLSLTTPRVRAEEAFSPPDFVSEAVVVKPDFKTHPKTSKEDLGIFTSYMEDGSGLSAPFEAAIHGVFVNGVFGLAKGIYSLTDTLRGALENNSILTNFADAQFKTSKKVYDKLMGTGFIYVAAFGVLLTLLIGLFKGRFGQSLLSLGLVLLVNGVFFMGGAELVKTANSAVTDVKLEVMKNIAGKEATDLHQLMVGTPFLYLNFDEVTMDGNGKLSIAKLEKGNSVEHLLKQGADKEGIKKAQKENEHLTYKSIGSKVSTAFSALFGNVFYALLYVFLSLIAFVFQLLALLLIAFGWLGALLSFYPKFNGTMLNFGKKVLQLMVMGILASSGTAVILLFNSVLNTVLSNSNIRDFAMQTWVKLLIIALLIVFRGQLVGLFSRGHLRLGRMVERISGQAGQMALAGASATANEIRTSRTLVHKSVQRADHLLGKKIYHSPAGLKANLTGKRKSSQLDKINQQLKQGRLTESKEKRLFAKGQRILEGRDSLPKVLQENLKAGKNKLWGPSPALEQSPLPVLDPKQKAAFEQKQNLNKLQKNRAQRQEAIKSRTAEITKQLEERPKYRQHKSGPKA